MAEHGWNIGLVIRASVLLVGVVGVTLLGEGLVFGQPHPQPNQMCCGAYSNNCCGCQGGTNNYFQLPSGNVFEWCTTNPNATEWYCGSDTILCFYQQNMTIYSQISGSGCSATCQNDTMMTGDATFYSWQCSAGSDTCD